MAQHYIGCKQIEAWPQEKDGKPGYAVRYPDGYLSWSPKDTFERACVPMGTKAGSLVNDDTVTEDMVRAFIRTIVTETRGKTTIVHATLVNGFELVESSSCVDPKNYSEEVGAEICRDRIRNRVWHLLGFLLQTARYGVRPS